MKTKHLIISIIILAGLLSACSGAAFTPSGWPGLTADQNTAYLASAQFVYAVDLSNGSQKWRFPEKASSSVTFYSDPGVTPDKQIIVGSYDKILYSLNTDGKQTWTNKGNDHFIAGPLIMDQAIYAPNADKNLYAYDLKGNLLWQFKTNGPIWAMPATDKACGCLYVASMDHFIYSISTQNGSQNWKTDLGSALTGTPAVGTDGKLYDGNYNSEMIGLNASDGKINWRTPLKGRTWSGPAVDGDRIYFGDLNGNFYALQTSDGKILWQIQADGGIFGTPLVTKDTIYFATEAGSVYAVDKTGKVVWNLPVGGKIYTAPVSSGDMILVAPTGEQAALIALNTGGTQRWSFTPPK
ncbi:MAG: PQQ-binding-like beta-propeller repeat protein [Omnitrophica WOR_2 bacterium]